MIEITATRKNSIQVASPVLFAAGAAGFDGSPYRRLLALDKFGGLVTPPLTLNPRQPASGPRVVPLPSGVLMHTGLPNPGVGRVIREYEGKWRKNVLQIIVHLVAESSYTVADAVRLIDQCPAVAGIELGVHDDILERELRTLLAAAADNTDLPVMVRLPLYHAVELGEVAQHGGAQALVVAAPPRGTARDPGAGRLIGGRLYGAWIKALALRAVGRVVQYAEVPVIACGGIHTPEDARDFIIAGAVAVQLDTVVWVNPKLAESIAVNLGGGELTRTSGALADEWEPGMVDQPDPPEVNSPGDDATTEADSFPDF